MLTESVTAEQWLKFVGKEKLQTFQDLFVQHIGASMAFFDLDGRLLTVWSRYSLFCSNLQERDSSRCTAVTQSVLPTLTSGDSRILSCPFGITCIFCPVQLHGTTLAYAYLGGMVTPDSKLSAAVREKFHLPTLTREEVSRLARLLEAQLRLLDVNTEALGAAAMPLPAAVMDSARDKRISKREWDIIELICHGLSNKQIAASLYISETTVKTHVSNILGKLDLRDRMQIIVHYYNRFTVKVQETSPQGEGK